MSEFSLIKSVKEYKPKENKPKIDYTPFDVIVEGKSVSVGIPTRVAKEFEDFLSENDSFTRRELRKVLRNFRGVREQE
jgi:hypothetical protein